MKEEVTEEVKEPTTSYTLDKKKYYETHKKKILEYNKEYRKKNKDKVKKWYHDYYKTHKEQCDNNAREWRQKNKEKVIKYVNTSRKKRAERLKEMGVPSPWNYILHKEYREKIDAELKAKEDEKQ